MLKLQGIAVSAGIAIGEALVLDDEGFSIPSHILARDAVQSELERLRSAVACIAEELQRHGEAVDRELGAQYAAIFHAQRQMLLDPQLQREIEAFIEVQHFSPEHAVSRVFRRYVRVFESLDSERIAQRAHDVVDIEKRLLRNLLGLRRRELADIHSPVVVLANNLTPSETANLNRRHVMAFVTEGGGPGSHTAIVAEGMEIPAVLGVGNFLTDVTGGEKVIVDGDQGLLILQPDEATLAEYQRLMEARRSHLLELSYLRDLPAVTLDGTAISLFGNIEFPHESQQCLERGSDGIGLYRTEFLYLGSDTEPSEEDHYLAYSSVVRAMQGKPVIIRTLDLGADKVHGGAGEAEKNPFLGLRSIRLALRNYSIFRKQLRALLRASCEGDLRIMFPLVSTLLEIRQAKMLLAEVMEDLDEAGHPFNRKAPIGMMVEVPSAVVLIDRFVREVDFLSIGTNDLIQYTLAVDRSNKDVASLYTGSDPAVLRLLQQTIKAANSAKTPISLCGQMSGNPLYTMLLLGLGLRSMSVPPSAIPEIKRVCRQVTISRCEALARRVMEMDHARDVRHYLKEALKQVNQEPD